MFGEVRDDHSDEDSEGEEAVVKSTLSTNVRKTPASLLALSEQCKRMLYLLTFFQNQKSNHKILFI